MTDVLHLHADHTAGTHRLPDDFWLFLPVLGPSSIITLQYFSDALVGREHVQLSVADLCLRFGHHQAEHRFRKTLQRLHDFQCLTLVGNDVALVRLELPSLHPGLIRRLPADLVPAYAEVPA